MPTEKSLTERQYIDVVDTIISWQHKGKYKDLLLQVMVEAVTSVARTKNTLDVSTRVGIILAAYNCWEDKMKKRRKAVTMQGLNDVKQSLDSDLRPT
jgi:hypothetical protein